MVSGGESWVADEKVYDVVVLGAGPAGLTAAMYAGRAALSVLVLEKAVPGGQAMNTWKIGNYPGFPDEIEGPELSRLLEEHARRFGAEIEMAEVTGVELTGEIKTIETIDGPRRGRTVILATGATPRKLGVPGEEEYAGRGVSYCATCDGAFFQDQHVAVVGGGDSALDEGYFLTRYASRLTVIHRRNEFRGTKELQDRLLGTGKVDVLFDTVVEEIRGNDMVEELVLRHVKTGETSRLPVNGVFIYVGMNPETELFRDQVRCDEYGYVDAGEDTITNVPGVFAAGDVRRKQIRQLVTATADGAVAAMMAEHYLAERRTPAAR